MKSVYLVAIIITILIGSFFNWILCCDAIAEEVVVERTVVEKTLPVNPLIIEDSTGTFSYRTNDNFNFHESDFIILRPLENGVDEGIEKLNDYISPNEQKFIDVTGFYAANERNNSAFPNLGLARANSVKNHLIAMGISSKKINTYGEIKEDLVVNDSIYVGPVAFLITEDSNFKNAEAVIARIKEEPIVLYFETGKSTITLTDEQRAKYLDIVRAMDKVDDISVVIYGHTDSTGSTENNMALGKGRAEFIKSYLVRNGIPETSIETISKGEQEPVADNNTTEGRAKNRRTVITIK
ncbi:OmpA family protein [Galbibacter mesophilus]|uniref:OmpA family protein n=1 Tax=Galbibacter mesophilus TaxID=379069 RepID=UPI00191E5958|nr:OmpA family protein [Galbibacter mesophilus]MCM5662438.1 OmpA family protein [Galbibacter mesophilus]